MKPSVTTICCRNQTFKKFFNRYLATRDATTLNAIDILTQCNGKVDLALEKLCQNPMPIIPQRMWCEDDTKAFIKGKTQKLH